jgi:hypothetical protein
MTTGSGPALVRALGRLLPSRIRERIFEPAVDDLLSAHHSEHRSAPHPAWVIARILLLYAETLRVGAVSALIREGRLTRFGRAALVLLLTALLLVYVRMRLDYGRARADTVGPQLEMHRR